jgi:hypothetical protein
MNPINMNPTNMMNPIGMATSFQGGGIMNMANSLGGPAGQMMNLASEIDGNSNDANPVKNLKKAEEEENHSKIENLFILNKKNCSYLIPSIMIDIISGSEYIYGKNKDEKSEDENDIENIKYIGIDLDCDTAYTLKDVLLLSGLTKPVETAMGVEAGEVEKKIDDMVATTKKMMNGKNMMGGKKMGSYSKRLVPKKRRLTRRRVKVTK